MRQTGIFASTAFVALQDWQEKMTKDHENARWMAEELASIPGVVIDPKLIETNIVRFGFEPKFLKDLKTDYLGVRDILKEKKILIGCGFNADQIRALVHRDLDRQDCEKFVTAIKSLKQ